MNTKDLQYGICKLSIVPVRSEPNDKSELSTQLIFGDAYSVLVLSENKKWIKIKSVFDDYEGWIDLIQHFEVSEPYFQSYIMKDHPINMDDIAYIDGQNDSFHILYGSSLPFLEGRKIKIGSESFSFEGDLYKNINLNQDFIKFTALRYMNAPYLWGGKTIFGTDCSGFMQIVYKIFGYKIKRDAYQQAEQGMIIPSVKDMKTGDLVFFENDNQKIVHVGMILEENKIIHAHGQVRIDIVDEKGIFNLTTKKYSHKFSRIKRILDY